MRLANLQNESAARSAAEAAIKAEAEKRASLDEELKKRETEIVKKDSALKESTKATQEAIARSSWLRYTEQLAAADAAFQDRNEDSRRETACRLPRGTSRVGMELHAELVQRASTCREPLSNRV